VTRRLPQIPLSPTGWAVVVALGVAAFIGLGLARPTVLGLQFDPFGLDRRKIESLTEERDYARSDADARGLEVDGERAQAERVDAYSHILIETRTLTATAEAVARSAPDANDPIPADRADRLRRHDDGLCEIAPTICAPAPAGPAGGRDDAVPPARSGAAPPADPS
jgi:hypothetical protein